MTDHAVRCGRGKEALDMNLGTAVVRLVLVAAVALAIRSLVRDHGSACSGCTGGCSSEGCSCAAADKMMRDVEDRLATRPGI